MKWRGSKKTVGNLRPLERVDGPIDRGSPLSCDRADKVNSHLENKMKRVAIHIDNLTGGGAERVLLNLAKGLVEKGYSVDFVLGTFDGEYVNDVDSACRIIEIGRNLFNFKGFRGIHKVIRLSAYIRKEKPDVIIAALGGPNTRLLLSRFLTHTGTMYVVSVHNHLSPFSMQHSRLGHIVKRCIIKPIYSLSDRIVAVSNGVADDLVDRFGLSRDKISVISNPNDILGIIAKSMEPTDEEWLVNKRFPVLVAVGRLAPVKAYDDLIKAFSIVRQRRKLRLLILGAGPQKSNLLKLIRSFQLEKDIRLAGFVSNPWAYMRNSDLLVVSSKSEAFSCVIVESMACGCPVVSTDCVGPSEILDHGKWGRIVPVGDVEALAEAIIDTLEKPIQRDDLINRAREFSAEKALDQYIRLIES